MKKIPIFLLCLLAGVSVAIAQTITTRGVVLSADDNAPIIGASVIVKGTTIGTITDMNGVFNLAVPSSAETLVVSFVGMITQEVPVSANMRVVLYAEIQDLEEVIVVAYGTQSARSVTASIASVRADALKDVPSVSFDQILQGRAAGVSVTTPSAAVGQVSNINVRGIGTINSRAAPLYVVDGIPILSGDMSSTGGDKSVTTKIGNANALADINPADILSIEILKDAAAASMYGSRAANGVVLITTKRGQQGRAKVSYDMNVGFSNRTGFPKLMDARQYTDFKNMAYRNTNGADAEDQFALMYDAKGNVIDTNWEDIVFRNGLTHNHTISVSGATDKTNYYLSANYTEQDGIVIGDHYNRLGVQANATVQANKWLKAGLNANYSNSQTSYVDAARNGSSFASAGFPRLALILAPNLPARNEDGTPYYEFGNGIGYGANKVANSYFNPVAYNDYGNGIDTYVNRIIASGFLEVTPVRDLRLKSQYGIDYVFTEDRRFWNPYHGDGYTAEGLANAAHGNRKMWTWTNTATYDLNLDKNHFNFLVGMEATQTDYNYWNVQGSGLNDFDFTGFETAYSTYSGGGGIFYSSMVSYFGRINYDYDYKYMLSANIRRDGYSPLGINNRWGNFGGVSGAWRISEEAFFDPVRPTIDDLKLKVSWGMVGNSDIGYYPAKSYYEGSYYGDGGAYVLTNVGDPNLKWESSKTLNAGVSMRLWNRLTLDVEYYNTRFSDLILAVSQASSTGIPESQLTTNAGKMKNEGMEITLAADIIKDRPFKWYSSFNITFSRNRVLELTDDILMGDFSNGSSLEITNITTKGKSLGQLYVYPTGGN